ncbi:MAG TPA: IS3 family transposase [Candidatus Aquicultor sp.]
MPDQRFKLIDEESAHHSISRLARVLGVTAAGYYAWKFRAPSERKLQDELLKTKIERIHKDSFGIYGAPRIHAELKANDICVGRKRVARLMKELGIEGVSKRGRRRITKPKEATPIAPDLVNRDFTATKPNELWIADITYIPTWQGWLFLSVVNDAYSRKVCGWSMRDDLKAELVIDALGMAVTRRRPKPGLIHHSDRGSQYAALAFGKTLKDSGIMASMGSRGDAYDNAAAESFMSTIKAELIHRQSWKTKDKARLAVFRYIECFYNPLRRHSGIGYLSPDEYEKLFDETSEESIVQANVSTLTG